MLGRQSTPRSTAIIEKVAAIHIAMVMMIAGEDDDSKKHTSVATLTVSTSTTSDTTPLTDFSISFDSIYPFTPIELSMRWREKAREHQACAAGRRSR